MPYNITAVANSSSMLQLIQRVNSELMFGWFGVLILLVIASVLFISFIVSTNSPRKAVAATSIICFGLCILLRAMSLVPDLALFVTLALAALTVAISRKE